jgi:uncharacterized protein YerC
LGACGRLDDNCEARLRASALQPLIHAVVPIDDYSSLLAYQNDYWTVTALWERSVVEQLQLTQFIDGKDFLSNDTIGRIK